MYKIYSNLLFLILLTFLINCSFGPGKRVWNDLSKDLETLTKDDSWFLNEGSIEPLKAFSNIEKQGIKVSDDVCDIYDI